MRLEKTFSLAKDLTFDSVKLHYSRMCHSIHATGEKVLQINQYLYYLIERKDRDGVLDLTLLFALISLPLTSLVKLLSKLTKKSKSPRTNRK